MIQTRLDVLESENYQAQILKTSDQMGGDNSH